MTNKPDITVNYCPVCGSDEIVETELSHSERFYCPSCNLENPYNIELWYNPKQGEFE